MHENQGNSVIYYAHYTEGGVNKTGLTVTIDVYEVIRDGTATLVVDDGACTEIGAGLYRYLLASASVDAAAEYIGVFHTATATVDAQDIPAMWVIDRAGTEKLDAGITLADDAITASKFDESTAFPVKSADTGVTAIARVGADGDTLETLSDQLDLTALEATLTAIKGAGWTTETLVAIKVLIDAIKAKTDGLDISDVTFVTVVNGTTITILRGDTFSGTLTDIGALTDYVSIDFTVKERYADTDDDAIIRIRKNASGVDDGLLRFNGEAPSSGALGSIAIDDLASGDITITLDETAADDLGTGTYVYDIQMISAAGVKTLTYGKVIVSADVTRLVA